MRRGAARNEPWALAAAEEEMAGVQKEHQAALEALRRDVDAEKARQKELKAEIDVVRLSLVTSKKETDAVLQVPKP